MSALSCVPGVGRTGPAEGPRGREGRIVLSGLKREGTQVTTRLEMVSLNRHRERET